MPANPEVAVETPGWLRLTLLTAAQNTREIRAVFTLANPKLRGNESRTFGALRSCPSKFE